MGVANSSSESLSESRWLRATSNGVRIVAVVTGLKCLVQVATQWLLVTHLAPQDFGLFALAQMVMGLFTLLSSIQGSRAVVQHQGGVERSLSVALILEGFLSSVAVLMLVFLAPTISRALASPSLTGILWLLAPSLWLNALLVPRAVFERQWDFQRSNFPTVTGLIGNSLVAIFLGVRGWGAWSLVIGFLVGKAIEATTLWRMFPGRLALRWDRQVAGEIVRFGLPWTASLFIGYLYSNVDNLMVAKWLGTTALGYYWVAYTFPHYLLTAQTALTNVLFPVFARIRDDQELKRRFEEMTRLSAVCFFWLCTLAVVFAEPCIRLIAGEEWLPAAPAFQIFMVLATLRGIFGHWSVVYTSRGHSWGLLINLVMLVLIPLLGYPLLRWHGITGMAMAVCLSYLICLGMVKWVMSRVLTFSYLRMVWKEALVFLLALITGRLLFQAVRPVTVFLLLLEMFLTTMCYIGIWMAVNREHWLHSQRPRRFQFVGALHERPAEKTIT